MLKSLFSYKKNRIYKIYILIDFKAEILFKIVIGEEMKTDTIAAIATAMSNSGISIVRISGDDAFFIADKIYRSQSGKKRLSECESHTVHYGFICDDEEIIDEVMVILMRAPHSYTREDSIEIDCHGGVYVTRRILETVIKYGARPAEPGEFTKRAFLNGRIDLTQAESVIDIINSKNEFALQSSLSQLKGSVRDDIMDMRGKLLHEIAFIESALDDPEHFSTDGYSQQLTSFVDETVYKIKKLLDTSDNGKMLKEGIRTVIVGKPNVGKSSLLNIMVGQERAIVTDIAGTTRDILEEQINLGGISLNIIDTAGIHNTSDIVEKIGVDRAKHSLLNADLILYVVDASKPLEESDYSIMELLEDKKVIVLLNKTDLNLVVSESDIRERLNHEIVFFSAKEHLGVAELEEKIKDMFFQGNIKFNDEIYITNARQRKYLQEALDSMYLVMESIQDGMTEDFFSVDMMNAYENLGNIIGEALEDDLVNEIFSKFCMGK